MFLSAVMATRCQGFLRCKSICAPLCFNKASSKVPNCTYKSLGTNHMGSLYYPRSSCNQKIRELSTQFGSFWNICMRPLSRSFMTDAQHFLAITVLYLIEFIKRRTTEENNFSVTPELHRKGTAVSHRLPHTTCAWSTAPPRSADTWATWLMCMLVSQVKGLADVRSLEPRRVEMIPF